MPKIMIESADYQKLIELAQKNSDVNAVNELDIIVKKYSVKKFINEIRLKLWSDVKRYEQGTDENKTAYKKYTAFNDFIQKLNEHFDDKLITYDMLTTLIKEQELQLQADGLQV
jgi:hypothetical protein